MGVFVQLVLIGPEHHKNGSKPCSTWTPFQNNIVKDVIEDLSVLDRFDDIVNKHFKPYHCYTCKDHWHRGSKSGFKIYRSIQKLR